MESQIEIIELPVGMELYRHIKDVPPEQCAFELRSNKGTKGRCNLHQDIYYCAKSLDALKIERGDNLKGSLVFSVVEQPILVGRVKNEDAHDLLRGRIAEEQPTLVHTEILQKVGKDIVTTYDVTNFITDCVLKVTPDGLMYSSVNSIDIIVGNQEFQLTEETGWGNIALTRKGYEKIKEYRAVDIETYFS